MSLSHPIINALRKRCPRCGEGKLFASLMRMHRRCPKCGLPLEPGPGYYIGALYPNYAITIVVVTAVYWFCALVLGLDQSTTLWISLALLFIFPVWFYPHARSLWLTMMYNIRTSQFEEAEAEYRKEEQGHNKADEPDRS